jgi:hypothetical protein
MAAAPNAGADVAPNAGADADADADAAPNIGVEVTDAGPNVDAAALDAGAGAVAPKSPVEVAGAEASPPKKPVKGVGANAELRVDRNSISSKRSSSTDFVSRNWGSMAMESYLDGTPVPPSGTDTISHRIPCVPVPA